MTQLKAAGCTQIYIDGSFVTNVRVDFQEIEAVKKSVQRWKKEKINVN